MKISIKFENQEDYQLFISLLRRIFKEVDVKKNAIGRNSYQLILDVPVQIGRPKVELSDNEKSRIIQLYQQGRSINSISNDLHISRRQIYKAIEERETENEYQN